MDIVTTIKLRPRFSITIDNNISEVINNFKKAKRNVNGYKISLSDHHVFIRIPTLHQHFWSPQLHLEFRENSMKTEIHGLYGPNPTVWTMFMFLHFILAILIIGASIWLYTLIVTNNSIQVAIILIISLIIIWLSFYIAGRLGRKKGNRQMHELNTFFYSILKQIKKS
ncbi:GTP-binding protein [Nonlabens mediterrranea]|uniref:GTP-binding protein n=1 Tax=Nonlabens mediterrranea TaxID=1419947 RepID=A0ABS0A4E6_9FLAO|nr:GTP-binding protein [Nonlabens mediterrranea]